MWMNRGHAFGIRFMNDLSNLDAKLCCLKRCPHGLVHRDIKPSNVTLDSSTTPARSVLTDFGIAKISDAHTRITNTGMLGTFDYIAPEQIQASAEVDGRADVYALGVMTYQLLTGRVPTPERSSSPT
jgi:serine/threonine protein kinase